MRALYEIEIGHTDTETALQVTLEEAKLAPELSAYAERLVHGIRKELRLIDGRLSHLIVRLRLQPDRCGRSKRPAGRGV